MRTNCFIVRCYPFRNRLIVFLLIIYSFCGNPAFSQEIDTDWLFYCNENENLSKIWRLNDNQSFATRRATYNKPRIKDIVLLEDGLISDSLNLRQALDDNDYNLQNVDNIDVLNDSTAFIRSGLMAFKVIVHESKIKFDTAYYREKFVPGRKKIMNQRMDLIHTYILRYNDIIIGYDRENLKNKRGGAARINKDFKNLPRYWIVDTKTWKKQYINEGKEEKTNDIFVDYKDWDQVWLRTMVFTPHVKILPDNKILFCVSKTNEIYVYDYLNKKTERYLLPAIEDGESFNFYYDSKFGHYYVIKKTSSNYTIFRTNKEFSKFFEIKSIDSYPHSIYNGKVNIKKEFKTDGEDMICHYAVPIYDDIPPAKFLNIDSLDIYNK